MYDSLGDVNNGAFNGLLRSYKRRARNNGREFTLSREQFFQITQMKCFYCKSRPYNHYRHRKNQIEYIYNGIDRRDNSQGYTIENSVPCCRICNYLKKAKSLISFKQYVIALYKNLKVWGS